jgi:hypothetical protein
MSNFFVSSFEKHQRIDGKESQIQGLNRNGHVTMKGIIEGKKFIYDNEPSHHKVFRKTPYPSSIRTKKRKSKRRIRQGKRAARNRRTTLHAKKQ